MSGWENLPQEQPAPPPQASTAAEPASPAAKEIVTDGDLIRAFERYFPALWIGMLAVVAFIGVYTAIGKLPNSPW